MGRNSFNAAFHSAATLTRQRNAAQAAKWNGGKKHDNPYLKRTPPVANLVDESAREALLASEAKAAKLKDLDLLTIAKRGLPPAEAIADLKARYPTAFEVEPVKHYSAMTPDEKAAFHRQTKTVPQGGRR